MVNDVNWRGYGDPNWLDFEWSIWLSLNPADGQLSDIPTEEGLYRIRHKRRDGLVYIGETGRSVRGRVRALARGTYADEMPFRDPHVGAPCTWAVCQEDGPDFEVSFIAPANAREKGSRKSIEAALIACYRRSQGESPACAFSRLIAGYSVSTYRKDGERGGPLAEGETEPYTEPGISPLDWEAHDQPASIDWMGLDWSTPTALVNASSDIPATDGVYRIWDPESRVPLEYIGESANLRSRLNRHRRNREGDLQFSFAAPEYIDEKHKRLEAETDLIGAHWLAVEQPPRDQH